MSKIYQLHGINTSFVLSQQDNKIPEIIYWDTKLSLSKDEVTQLEKPVNKSVPQAFLDKVIPITLLPTLGEGVFQFNALSGFNRSNAWAPQFKVRNIDQSESSALMIYAFDEIAALDIVINISINEFDVISSSIQITNTGEEIYVLDALGLSMVLPNDINQITQFHGRWIHEFQTEVSTWDQPNYYVENLKGRTSNDNPPLLMLATNATNQQQGCVYGFHLGWSGNHYYKLMSLNDGQKLVQFGEKLLPGEITLQKNESYLTPVLHATFSDCGYNGMSQHFHLFIRKSGKFAQHKLPFRPIHFNTWEAMYFDHPWEKLTKLVERATQIGIERFILDDGWFKGRNHERAGLGDWFIDENKYPHGLKPLIDYVDAHNMQFGLWFEPEMVNPDSDLFRNHPDWMLQVSNYDQPLGRYQYVLNLANNDAYEYIHNCLSALLSENKIGYIKWDMNRDLVQAGDLSGKPNVHNQVLATYRLLQQLNQEFPDVEIESCSSGGARADLGVLRYTNRVWTSDCNDPCERQKIQKGFSYFFPPEIMGSHFGPEVAHTTNRMTSLEYRILTSFFGHLGFEQNLLELSDDECKQLAHYLQLYKHYRSLIHSGDFIRLNTSDIAQNIYGVVNDVKTQALFAIAQIDFPKTMLPAKLKIPYLDLTENYKLKLLNQQDNIGYLMKQQPSICCEDILFSGNLLARVGIDLPIMHPESILLLLIEQV